MIRIVEQTREEKIEMYMKCTKKELAEMLLECNKYLKFYINKQPKFTTV